MPTFETLLAFWSEPMVTVNFLVFLNLAGALLLVGDQRSYHGRDVGMCAVSMVWISKLEEWRPSRLAVAFTLKFVKNLRAIEAAAPGTANVRGYDIAGGTNRTRLREGRRNEILWRLRASATKISSLQALTQQIAQFSGVGGFRPSDTRNSSTWNPEMKSHA